MAQNFFGSNFFALGKLLRQLDGNLVLGQMTPSVAEFFRLLGFPALLNFANNVHKGCKENMPFFVKLPAKNDALDGLARDNAAAQRVAEWKARSERFVAVRGEDPWRGE